MYPTSLGQRTRLFFATCMQNSMQRGALRRSDANWRYHYCSNLSSTALARVVKQSSPSVRLSAVRLFPLYLRKQLTVDLGSYLHVNRSWWTQLAGDWRSRSYRSWSRSCVRLMWSVWPRSRTVFLVEIQSQTSPHCSVTHRAGQLRSLQRRLFLGLLPRHCLSSSTW